MHPGLLVGGIVALLLGAFPLLRPGAARRLLGLADSDGAVYALRMAGTMAGAFGLVLVGFAIVLGRA